MKSYEHVLWRGALALSLMTVGVGSGFVLPPAETSRSTACEDGTRILIVRTGAIGVTDHVGATAVMVRRGNLADSES